MASNFSCNSGRARLVDPNNFGQHSSDNFSVPLEDLNVSVILKSFRKGRTLLTSDDNGDVSENIAQIDVNFIEGSDVGGKKVLTSRYTDLTTVFDKDFNNDETLGITSIDIEFDSSYTPRITINFVDVRGSSIFQNEEHILNNEGNKYTTFFQLPYPMFELEVKGYYGLPVKYCLHLLKFNSKFNSKTGNFEIKCEFIGYTFALMADMLLGYLRAIPYTTIGQQKLSKYIEETGRDILTLDDLAKRISEINEGLKREAGDNPASQQINSTNDILEYLQTFKDRIKTLSNEIDLNSEKTNYDFIILKHVNEFNKDQKLSIDNAYIENMKTDIAKYNELTDETYKLNEADFINIKTETNTNGGKLYKKITKLELTNNDEDNNNNLKTKFGCTELTQVADIKNKLLEHIRKYNEGLSDGEEIDVFDMSILNGILNQNTIYLNEKLENEKRNLAEDFADVVREELTFTPTIRPMIEMFTAAIEVFVETIYEVSKSAEGNGERTEVLSEKFTPNDTNVSDIHEIHLKEKNYFPWPDYRERENATNTFTEDNSTDNTGAYVDKYLGASGVLSDPNKVDELVFIEDLLQAFRKSYKAQQDTINDAEKEESTWYPINVLDSFIFGNSEPYERMEFLNVSDIVRMMVIRAMTFFGYSYYEGLISDEQLAALAQIEVDAMLRGVKDEKLRKSITDSDLNTFKSVSGTTNSNVRPLLESDDKYVTYNYIFKDLDWKILPINKGFNDDTWYYEKNNTKNTKKRDDEGYLFLTNYSGNQKAGDTNYYKYDDGGIYMKILDSIDTPKQLYGLPEGLTNENTINFEKIKQGTIDSTAGLNCFGGDYGVQEFKNMDWGNESLKGLPLMYVFYRDCDSGLSLTRKGSGASQGLKFDTESNYFYKDKKIFEWPNKRTDAYLSKNGYYMHDKLGSNRELFNHLVNGGIDDLSYPYIEFKGGVPETNLIGIFKDELRNPYTDNAFSLFGSDLYYRQAKYAFILTSDGKWVSCTEYSRAYLFLHTLPFNTPQNIGNPFGKNELINLFKNSSGLIHAPKLWCAYIGAILWRYSALDPILDSSKNIIGGGAGKYRDSNDNKHDVISWNDDFVNGYPDRDEYTNFLDIDGDQELVSYPDIKKDDLITRIPKQVRDEFKRIFFEFVNGTGSGVKWRDIADKLEIFDSKGGDSYLAFIEYLKSNIEVKSPNTDVNNILNFSKTVNGESYGVKTENVTKFYDIITPMNSATGVLEKHTLFLELRDGTSAVKTLLTSLMEEVIIVNTNYKIWLEPNGNKKRLPIFVTTDTFNTYFNKVNEILKSKSDELNPAKAIEKTDVAIFGTSNKDVIKLQLYRTCKNIYDKWISGAKDENSLIFQCGGRSLTDTNLAKKYSGKDDAKPRMIDSFRFVARNFRDIGDKLYVNPLPINNYLLDNVNTSSYDIISNLLSENNFNFIPLPNFINFNDDKVMTSLFKPFNYNVDRIPDGACGPSFVCVYAGQSSKHLDYGRPQNTTKHSSKYPNDGFDLRCYNGNQLNPDAPDDFVAVEDKKDYEEPVSAFVVKYSQQNQNIFKDIDLDQSEFSETDESLKIQDEISQKGSENNRSIIGQNIYNVYAVRSYTAKVEMMGNAMIQPMMYFQLDNIPMFHGAYLITKVSHSITPNSMSTHFQGTRIRYPETPLIKAYDVYMSLLDTYDTSSAGNGVVGGGGTIDPNYDVIPDAEVVGKFGNPYKGTATINSIPGLRTLDGNTRQHKGIDFGIKEGTDLLAVYDGEIEMVAFDDGGFGLYMVINHGVIGDKTYQTLYGHMSDISSVVFGRTRNQFTNDDIKKILNQYHPKIKVKKGDVIGKSGGKGGPYLQGGKYNTSGLSTGAHLHWELRIGDKSQNGANVYKLKPISGLRFIPAGKDYNYGDSGDGAVTEIGSDADFWSLAAICTLEAGIAQARCDVAQSIYNRLATPGQPYGKSLKEIIVAKNQYEPTFKSVGKWKAIKDKDTAIKAIMASKGWDKTKATNGLNESIKAITDKTLQNNSKSFIGTRTEFLAYYPKSSKAQNVVHRSTPSSGGGNGGNNYFYWQYAGVALIGKAASKAPDFSSFT